MIRFKCEECGQKFKVADNLAGKKGKCHKCGGVIVIPDTELIAEGQIHRGAGHFDSSSSGSDVFPSGEPVEQLTVECLPKTIFVSGESSRNVQLYKLSNSSDYFLLPIFNKLSTFESWKRASDDDASCFKANTDAILSNLLVGAPQLKYLVYNPTPADGCPDGSDEFLRKFPRERMICMHNFDEVAVVFKKHFDELAFELMKSEAEKNPHLKSKEILDEVMRFAEEFNKGEHKTVVSQVIIPASPEAPDDMEKVFNNPFDGDGFKEALGFRPETNCSKCGECQWDFLSLSHNAISAKWKCSFCGREIICNKNDVENNDSENNRLSIPKSVQREVWRRDKGKCVDCGSQEKLEFDHIIPVSKGGSNTVRNIQLLCEKCNRKKGNTI